MKIFWLILSFLLLIVGIFISVKIGASHANGQLTLPALMAGIGQVFGLPIIILIIISFFKEHRNLKSYAKAFSISTLIMVITSIGSIS